MTRSSYRGVISAKALRVKIICFGLAALRLAYLDKALSKFKSASAHKFNNKNS